MKTVFPVADSSCTMPLMRRFSAGATGMTRRPSRTVGFTSLSTMPSAWAERRMELSVRDMLPVVAASSRRISARAREALSLILPNLLTMPSMRRMRVGKECTSDAKAARLGYWPPSFPPKGDDFESLSLSSSPGGIREGLRNFMI